MPGEYLIYKHHKILKMNETIGIFTLFSVFHFGFDKDGEKN